MSLPSIEELMQMNFKFTITTEIQNIHTKMLQALHDYVALNNEVASIRCLEDKCKTKKLKSDPVKD